MQQPSSNKTLTITVIVIAVVMVVGGIAAALQVSNGYNASNAEPTDNPTAKVSPSPTSSLAAMNATARTAADLTLPEDAITPKKVALKTSMGTININLMADVAPKTVTNFATLGKRGYYNGIIFHRIIKDFMFQGGDPTGTGTSGESIYGKKFPDELEKQPKFEQGVVAMANSGPNTNGSQFFVFTGTTYSGPYTIFGKIADADSLKIAMAIQGVPVRGERPVQDVTITGFDVLEN